MVTEDTIVTPALCSAVFFYMKTEAILHIIDYIKAIERTELELHKLGWDVEVPPANYVRYSLHEVVMDLIGIPPDVNGFSRDTYFDCFYQGKNSADVFTLLIERFEEWKPEYIKAGIIEN